MRMLDIIIKKRENKPLTLTQAEAQKITCHAMEFRINAEDPETRFTPCPGEVKLMIPAGGIGVRVDTHVYSGYRIPPYYDSMIAKLIVKADDREQCIARCRRALGEFVVEGVKTTIPFSQKILHNKDFVAGKYDTGFVERSFLPAKDTVGDAPEQEAPGEERDPDEANGNR